MSFTSEIKQEVSYNDLKNCCARAELSALLQMTGSQLLSSHHTGFPLQSFMLQIPGLLMQLPHHTLTPNYSSMCSSP